MRAERVGAETLLAQIVQMVAEAQRSRAPIQKLADKVAGYFVPAVVSIAVATAVVWGIVGPEPRMAHALVNAVAVLIIACPCALGLATPMSIMVATGKGATAGVLFRNAEAIEILRKVDTLVIDKTGTLTEGKPKLVSVVPVEGWDEKGLLRLAASLERGSEHPLAAAIVAGAQERGVEPAGTESFESVTGKGVKGRVDGRSVGLGNRESLREHGDRPGRARRKGRSAAQGRADGDVRRGGRQGGRTARCGRPGQGNHPRSDPATPRRGDPDRDAHRRQQDDGRSRRREAGPRRGDGRGPSRPEGATS